MSTHNIGFYEDLTKIIFEYSSNMHLISSAVCLPFLLPLGILQTLPNKTRSQCLLSNDQELCSKSAKISQKENTNTV